MIKVYGAEICVDCRNFKAIKKIEVLKSNTLI